MDRQVSIAEKKQWEWAKFTHPKNVNDTHIYEAYLIKYRPSSCHSRHIQRRASPFCLFGIGQQHWFKKSVFTKEDLNLELRKNDDFVGLRNLGATCYINSLLQLWFHNINIRNAILNWNPEEDEIEKENQTLLIENGYEPVTIIGQLQLVFAMMQFGQQKTVNPEAFIISLKIDTNAEQDIGEFSNLLLESLKKKFQTQSNRSVREMVENYFLGQYIDVTTCLTCGDKRSTLSSFKELSLSIKGHKTLEDSLEEYLTEEDLVEENQYFCRQCNKKQNAVRQTCLTALPSVLNFQLMRFIYDRNLKQKIKLNTFIEYPETLNMEKYLNYPNKLNATQFPSRECYKYNLYAVLIHEGSSANFGHYVVQIKDSTTQEWYHLNDENVAKLNDKKSNFCKKYKIKLKKNGLKSKIEEFQTKDAYMLVYIQDTNATKLNICDLSPRLNQIISTRNNDFRNKISEFNQFNEIVSNMYKYMNCSDLNLEKDEGDVISLDWLKSWLKKNPNENPEKICNKSVLCKHNLLNPDKVLNTKFISSTLADKLYNAYSGGPRLKLKSSLCVTCVKNKCALIYTKQLTSAQSQAINKVLKKWNRTDDLDGKNKETCYWVGIESFKSWQQKYYESFQTFLNHHDVLPNTSLPINHEILSAVCMPVDSPYDIIQFNKDMEQDNIQIISETENLIKPEFNINILSQTKTECIESFQQLNEQEILPSKDMNSEIKKNTKRMPWTFNCDITCPHGHFTCRNEDSMMLVPEKIMKMFQNFFPKASLFTKDTKPCSLCRSVHIRVLICKYTCLFLATKQNCILNDLVWMKNRIFPLIEPSPYPCITREFLVAFQKFAKSPFNEPIPTLIRNKALLCEDHNKLVIIPPQNLDLTQPNDSELVIISKKEWKMLLKCYDADFGVFLYYCQDVFITSKPEICETCYQMKLEESKMKLLQYKYEKIFIQVTNITQLSNSTKKFKQMPKTELIIVSSDNTLLHLKMKIMEVFHVMPNNQCLKTSEGVELTNINATLADLKILPQSIILAQFNEDKIQKPEVVTIETGFKGTELMH